MSENPYQSPSLSERSTRGQGTFFFRLLAIPLWLASLLPVLGLLSIVSRSDFQRMLAQNWAWTVFLCAVMFALPSAAFGFLGCAAWLRNRWIALAGVASILPIILLTIARFCL